MSRMRDGTGRWMYISLYTHSVGKEPLPETFKYILGNYSNENILIRFVLEQEITGLLLYNLHKILPNQNLSEKLGNLLTLLKRCGVVRVYGVGATREDWIRIANFYVATGGKLLEGMVTEIEFWNMPSYTVNTLSEQLDYMKSVSLSLDESYRALKVAVYVGWFRDSINTPPEHIARILCSQTDLIFLHGYSTTPKSCYYVTQERLDILRKAAASLSDISQVPIVPIFDAEGMRFNAWGEHYLGDWIIRQRENGNFNQIQTLENIYSLMFASNSTGSRPSICIEGFCYYEYAFLMFSLNGGINPRKYP